MDNSEKEILKEALVQLAELAKPDLSDLNLAKRKAAAKGLGHPPKNSQLLAVYHELVRKKVLPADPVLARLLVTRRVRSLSGVAVVAVLTKPHPCPGRCLYCPEQAGVPKSYLRDEPAVMRAIAQGYDPCKQVKSRLAALEATGHPTDKIELIVIGGTWSFLPDRYQKNFIHRCFQAANGRKSGTLSEAQRINARARHRIVGLTLETRPDYINEQEIRKMRELGATKVELGVQCLDDDILAVNRRGHGSAETAQATQLLKDAGFKVGYHLMLNLPGATTEQEKDAANLLFRDERFRPDFLKIYPTAILPDAPLYRWWKQGKYQPYRSDQLIELMKFVKRGVPRYCRIQRVIRDIPSVNVPIGPVKTTNLRQIVLAEMEKQGTPCRCIRCREIKEARLSHSVEFFREDYDASGGKEIFLSFEDAKRQKLSALLRLRIPDPAKEHFWPVLERSALIREVHTYGQHLPIGQKDNLSAQHRGLGKRLMLAAEDIVRREFPDIKRMVVIAGVGTRDYYRKFGYRLRETYMVKKV